MSNLFWLTGAQMTRLRAVFPKSHGRPRGDDLRVLGGIILINSIGLRWYDVPKECGLPKTLYNRWKRWSDNGVSPGSGPAWPPGSADPKTIMIDATYLQAHRTACSLRAKKGGEVVRSVERKVRGKKKLPSGQFRPRTEHKAARRHRCERPPDQVLHVRRTSRRLHRSGGASA